MGSPLAASSSQYSRRSCSGNGACSANACNAPTSGWPTPLDQIAGGGTAHQRAVQPFGRGPGAETHLGQAGAGADVRMRGIQHPVHAVDILGLTGPGAACRHGAPIDVTAQPRATLASVRRQTAMWVRQIAGVPDGALFA